IILLDHIHDHNGIPRAWVRSARQRQSQFHVSGLISEILFVQKSPLSPLFQRGELKVSLCKGRFRGIFNPAQDDFDEP
ncbi:MAG: hypothetical protein ACREOR_04335, partial [Candidatus Binatia bacterium]